MLDPAKLTTLATQYDPFPVLEALNSQSQAANFMTMPTPGGAQPAGNSFNSIIQAGGAQPATPAAGPTDPRLMMAMMQMGQQKPPQMPMAPAAAPRATPQVQFQPVAPAAGPSSMSKILGR